MMNTETKPKTSADRMRALRQRRIDEGQRPVQTVFWLEKEQAEFFDLIGFESSGISTIVGDHVKALSNGGTHLLKNGADVDSISKWKSDFNAHLRRAYDYAALQLIEENPTPLYGFITKFSEMAFNDAKTMCALSSGLAEAGYSDETISEFLDLYMHFMQLAKDEIFNKFSRLINPEAETAPS